MSKQNDFPTGWRSGNEVEVRDENDMYCPKVGGLKGSNNFRKDSCLSKQMNKDVKGCSKNCKAVATGAYSYTSEKSTPEQRQSVRQMILAGKEKDEIIKKLGVKENLIYRTRSLLKQNGEI